MGCHWNPYIPVKIYVSTLASKSGWEHCYLRTDIQKHTCRKRSSEEILLWTLPYKAEAVSVYPELSGCITTLTFRNTNTHCCVTLTERWSFASSLLFRGPSSSIIPPFHNVHWSPCITPPPFRDALLVHQPYLSWCLPCTSSMHFTVTSSCTISPFHNVLLMHHPSLPVMLMRMSPGHPTPFA